MHMHSYRIVGGSDARGARRSRGRSSTGGAGLGRNRGQRAGCRVARVLESPAILIPKRQAPKHFTPCGLQIFNLCPLFPFVANGEMYYGYCKNCFYPAMGDE
jgi:hypothetical protein